jgi:N-formylglutamate deformylase
MRFVDPFSMQRLNKQAGKVLNGGGNIILAVPHSGFLIPEMCWDNILKTDPLYNDYDLFSDELYCRLTETISYVISSNIHRYAVDLNRSQNDRRKEGVLREIDFDGNSLLKRPYTDEEREIIIKRCHEPFHQALFNAVKYIYEKHKKAFVLNCHTMRGIAPKTAIDHGRKRPDFNIGVAGGTLADKLASGAFISYIESQAQQHGWSVEIDNPYTGNIGISAKYGKPERGLHSLLIEVNRDTARNKDSRRTISEMIDKALEAVYMKALKPRNLKVRLNS